MRAREVLKLQIGDTITCEECKDRGCDGKPAKVRVITFSCGCKEYLHSRNRLPFYHKADPNCGHGMNGWARNGVGYDQRITGRSIKLIRRKG